MPKWERPLVLPVTIAFPYAAFACGTELFLCLPRGLFAATHRMSEWEVRPPPAYPAFEVIYVYAGFAPSLNFRGSRKAIEPLQGGSFASISG